MRHSDKTTIGGESAKQLNAKRYLLSNGILELAQRLFSDARVRGRRQDVAQELGTPRINLVRRAGSGCATSVSCSLTQHSSLAHTSLLTHSIVLPMLTVAKSLAERATDSPLNSTIVLDGGDGDDDNSMQEGK